VAVWSGPNTLSMPRSARVDDMRHSACGCGRDDRNGSSVDGFQAPGRAGGGRVWAIARAPLEVTLCPLRPPTLPWQGSCRRGEGCTAGGGGPVGARLKVDPGVLAGYGARGQARTDHLLVTDYLGWKSAPAAGGGGQGVGGVRGVRGGGARFPVAAVPACPSPVASSLGGPGRD
jgi:hypothetical protein